MTDYSTAICRSYRTILHVMMLFVIIKQANMGKMLRIITIINFVIVIIPITNWFNIDRFDLILYKNRLLLSLPVPF